MYDSDDDEVVDRKQLDTELIVWDNDSVNKKILQ
jgi:hypothetical protein